MNTSKIVWLVLLFSFSGLVLSKTQEADIHYKEIEILLDTENKNEAIKQAIDQVSIEMIQKFIGKEKYEKNKKKIEQQIIRDKNRYILIARTASPEVQDDGKIMIKVTLGISKKNFQSVLLDNNLYYSSNQALCILPVVHFETEKDGEVQKYVWWESSLKNEPFFPQDVAASFFKSLVSEFIKSGFYTIDPVFSRVYEQTPTSYLPFGNRVSSFIKTARFLNCNIIMSGRAVFTQISHADYKAYFSFTFFNIKTKTVLATLQKKASSVSYNKKSGFDLGNVLKSLNYQLNLYKKSGSLEVNKLYLSIQGLENYRDTEKLKKILEKKVVPIKNLKERVLASQKIIYEVDTLKDANALAQALNEVKTPGFSMQLVDHNKKQIEIYAHPQSGK